MYGKVLIKSHHVYRITRQIYNIKNIVVFLSRDPKSKTRFRIYFIYIERKKKLKLST